MFVKAHQYSKVMNNTINKINIVTFELLSINNSTI